MPSAASWRMQEMQQQMITSDNGINGALHIALGLRRVVLGLSRGVAGRACGARTRNQAKWHSTKM